MLVIFKSKAGADIMMFEENAKQILDLFGKDTHKGIITADETEAAIVTLEKEIEHRKKIEAEEKAERERLEQEERERLEKEKEENWDNDDDKDRDPYEEKKQPPPKPEPPVSFSARSYPFLQLLKAASKKKKDIYWGV